MPLSVEGGPTGRCAANARERCDPHLDSALITRVLSTPVPGAQR